MVSLAPESFKFAEILNTLHRVNIHVFTMNVPDKIYLPIAQITVSVLVKGFTDIFSEIRIREMRLVDPDLFALSFFPGFLLRHGPFYCFGLFAPYSFTVSFFSSLNNIFYPGPFFG